MQCVDRHQLLLRHLMIKLAPVLLGVKPAGMVRLTNCGRIGGGAQCDLFCLHQREILEALHLECRILRNDGINLVVLFFRRAVLERTLESSEAAGFLKECGYPSGEGMAAILEELTARCRRGGNFPHEIGIFLGYPLKDVRGFIEDRSACRPVPRGLWRVAGDPAESLAVMEKFRCAEAEITRLLRGNVAPAELMRQIHNAETAA